MTLLTLSTSDMQAFNDGFDHACRRMLAYNERGSTSSIGIRMAVSGMRNDRWWREGVKMALEWAERNWERDHQKAINYRQPDQSVRRG